MPLRVGGEPPDDAARLRDPERDSDRRLHLVRRRDAGDLGLTCVCSLLSVMRSPAGVRSAPASGSARRPTDLSFGCSGGSDDAPGRLLRQSPRRWRASGGAAGHRRAHRSAPGPPPMPRGGCARPARVSAARDDHKQRATAAHQQCDQRAYERRRRHRPPSALPEQADNAADVVGLEHDLDPLERAKANEQGEGRPEPQQPCRQSRRSRLTVAAPCGHEPQQPKGQRQCARRYRDDRRDADVAVTVGG